MVGNGRHLSDQYSDYFTYEPRLFSKSANLLVLDEPTNDLDMETLELLEEILLTFEGTVLLVSHDRDFMDNVITSLMVLDGTGGVKEYVGGYSDWEARGGSLSHAQARAAKKASKTQAIAEKQVEKPIKTKKLSYNEQRELANLPGIIEKLETRKSELEREMSEPGFYESDFERVQEASRTLVKLEQKLEIVFDRWNELDQ